ncbi:unnamed protein product [Arctogadus glacialis]
MEDSDVLKLRVILDDVNAERLILPSRPETINALISELYLEFHRITNQNLPYSFFSELDKYTSQLLKLYKKKTTGRFGEKLQQVVTAYEEQDKNNITAARTAALAGLPLYLKEDSSDIFKTCTDESEVSQEEAVALVAVVAEDEGLTGVPFDMQHVSIILEGQVMPADPPNTIGWTKVYCGKHQYPSQPLP